MARVLLDTLQAPAGSTLLADFTDGTHGTSPFTSGDMIKDLTFADAGTRAYSIDSNGASVSFLTGTTGQYASWTYRPAGGAITINTSDTDWLAFEIEYPEGDSSFAGQFFDAVSVFVVTETGASFTNYWGPKTFNSGADKMPHRMILMVSLHELAAAGVGGTGITGGVIGQISLRFFVSASAQNVPAKIIWRKLWKGKNRPQVLLCWDDAYAAQYTNAYSVMTTAGLRGSLFPSSSYIGSGGKITENQCRIMYNAGWSFGVQETNDVTDQPIAYGTLSRSGTTATFTPATQQANPFITAAIAAGDPITIYNTSIPAWNTSFASAGATCNASTGIITFTCAGTETTPATGALYVQRTSLATWSTNLRYEITYWASRGIDASKFIAYSGGNIGDLNLPSAGGAGFKLGRSTATGVGVMAGCFDPRLTSSRSLLQLPGRLMDNQTGATCLGYVDTAEQRGASIILYGHDQQAVGSASAMSISEFNILINGDSSHIGLAERQRQGRIDIVTFDEFYGKIGGTNQRLIITSGRILS